jgi:hypothetical protein
MRHFVKTRPVALVKYTQLAIICIAFMCVGRVQFFASNSQG